MINRQCSFKIFLLMVFCLTPEALQVVTGSGSTNWSYSLISVIVFFYMIYSSNRRRILQKIIINPYVIVVTVIIFIHGLAAAFFVSDIDHQFSIDRFALSYVLIFFLLVHTAYIISVFYSRDLKEIIYGSNVIFAIAGIMGVLGYTFLGAWEDRKPIMLFSEISHYANFIAPFYCFLMVYKGYGAQSKIVMSLIYVVTILRYESATLLFVVIAVLVISLARFQIGAVVLTGIVIYALANFANIDISYYVSRASTEISDESTNMSLLAGFEEALISINNTYGIGYGFQQMGVNPPKGSIAAFAFSIAGDYVNRYDGSVSVTKMIVEFGLIGVVLTIAYIGVLIHSLYAMVGYVRGNIDIGVEIIFAHCCIFSFGVYHFVRGGGYFGYAYSFVIAAIVILYGKSRRLSMFKREVASHIRSVI